MKLDTEEDSDVDSPPEKPTSSRVKSEPKKDSNDSEDDEEEYSPSKGVIPPSLDVGALPELTINLPSRRVSFIIFFALCHVKYSILSSTFKISPI